MMVAQPRNVRMTAPSTDAIRPFLPAKDFEASKSFYEALGFQKVLDGEVAIFRAGASEFVLQRFYHKEFADNCMLQLVVDDLDSRWALIEALDLPGRFRVRAPQPPKLQPWGLRVAFVFDPSGVLWHVTQRRPSP